LSGAPHGALCGALLVPVLRANRTAMAAAGLPTDRMDQVEGWIAEALDVPPATALDALEGWMSRHGLPAPRALLDPALAPQAARDAARSSSMKGNPVVLDADTLAGVLTAGRG
ncbi:hypothetical protein CCR87_14225, partial [Rhodobaculum claviforme]|nr:hypothetical protein [Rhodobaculum claviforme]